MIDLETLLFILAEHLVSDTIQLTFQPFYFIIFDKYNPAHGSALLFYYIWQIQSSSRFNPSILLYLTNTIQLTFQPFYFIIFDK